MIVLSALLCGAFVGDELPELSSRIVEANIFRNGTMSVVREVYIPPGGGVYKLDVVPDAASGTFWYEIDGDGQVNSLRTKWSENVTRQEVQLFAVGDILIENVGNQVSLSYRDPNNRLQKLRGEVRYVSPAALGTVIIDRGGGKLTIISVTQVVELDVKGLDLVGEVVLTEDGAELVVDVSTENGCTLLLSSIETGATWAPSYRVTLSGERCTIDMKTQVAVGPREFDDTRVGLIAGRPGFPSAPVADLASGLAPLVDFIAGVRMPRYRPGAERDPFDALKQQYTNQGRPGAMPGYQYADALYRPVMAFASSVFAGVRPGGYSPGGVDNPYYYPSSNVYRDPNQPVPLNRVEDLFRIDVGLLTLERGERLTRSYRSVEGDARHLYRWTVRDYITRSNVQRGAVLDEVEHLIRLTSDEPFVMPDGDCLVMKDGLPLAKSEMPFTAAGQKASVVLGAAVDIPVTHVLQEIERERIDSRNTEWFGWSHTKYTREAHFKIVNTRKEAIEFELVYEIIADLVDANPDETETIRLVYPYSGSSRYHNPSRNTWRFTIEPGEEKILIVKHIRRE
ncbi:MAG: hypothetical protein IH944_04275 [Armatimonadetes bacterium]|nr:hypothetical protein [Armatimonadota bacterium]